MCTCKYCGKEFNNMKGLNSHYGLKHPEHFLHKKVFSDVTLEEFKVLRSKYENGTCMICGKHETANTRPDTKKTSNNLCADHDHVTGKYRGFLCVQCNRNMGWYDKYKSDILKYISTEHK